MRDDATIMNFTATIPKLERQAAPMPHRREYGFLQGDQ
jgi:hypothetical protein